MNRHRCKQAAPDRRRLNGNTFTAVSLRSAAVRDWPSQTLCVPVCSAAGDRPLADTRPSSSAGSSVRKSSLRSNRSVRAEHLLQVTAERLIIVEDQHLLIRVQRPLGNAKGPFRPSRAESITPDDHRYPGGARGAAAGIEYGADVRANSGRLEPLPQLLDMNVEIRRLDNHIFHRLQRSGGSLAHRLPFIGLWHNTLLFYGHSERNGWPRSSRRPSNDCRPRHRVASEPRLIRRLGVADKLFHRRVIINLATAKKLGLTVPPVMLGRADEVIDLLRLLTAAHGTCATCPDEAFRSAFNAKADL